jgi:hypothetical protein
VACWDGRPWVMTDPTRNPAALSRGGLEAGNQRPEIALLQKGWYRPRSMASALVFGAAPAAARLWMSNLEQQEGQ